MNNRIELKISEHNQDLLKRLSQWDEWLELCKRIVNSKRLEPIFDYVNKVLDSHNFEFWISKTDPNSMGYILFHAFAIPDGIFLAHRLNKKELWIIDKDNLDELQKTIDDSPLITSNVLYQIKDKFGSKKEFGILMKKGNINKDLIETMHKDIKEIINKTDSSTIKIEAKNGKPTYWEVDFRVKDTKRIEEIKGYVGKHGWVYPIGEERQEKTLEWKKRLKRKDKDIDNTK